MDWEQDVARIVDTEILVANGGCWPETIEDWQRLVHRFGMGVVFQPLPFKAEHSLIFLDAIHVPEPIGMHPTKSPAYRHELAEAVLLWEGREPYCYPPENSREARHRVARMLERG